MVEIPQQEIGASWLAHKDFKTPFVHVIARSNQAITLHRLDMGDLIQLGIAEEMDFMSKALIAGEESAKSANPGEAVAQVVKRSANYAQMEKMINLVCLAGIDSPKIYPVPMIRETDATTGESTERVNENARQPGLFYIDQVPWDDRSELFSVIFETGGISDFRQEQEAPVGDVADDASVSLPADGPVALPSENTEGVLSE